MNILQRIFNGRIAKPRQAATDQQEGDPSPRSSFSPRSPTNLRRSRSPISRGGSGTLAPALARRKSPQHSKSSHSGVAAFPEVRIKQEDEEVGSFAMAPPQYNNLGYVARHDQIDTAVNEMDTGDASNGAESPQTSLKEEPGDDNGSFLKDAVDYDDGTVEEDASEGELITRLADPFNSDQPIPSIEDDDEQGDHEGDDEQDEHEDDDEEDEEGDHDKEDDEQDQVRYQPRKKAPVYLQGMAHRADNRASGSEPGDGADDEGHEIEYEDSEEELRGEMEENLLIDDSDLRYYLHHKRDTTGWPHEARRLYKLLYLRGLFPVFESQWTWGLSQHPVPRELFVPLGCNDKCLLKYERSNGYASRAIRNLFQLHIDVGWLRTSGTEYSINRIAPVIKKEIERYVLWAERDCGFYHKRDYVSPVCVLGYRTPQAASIGQPIVERCQAEVKKYRAGYEARGIGDYPRCIYIFVVVQHLVLVMVADTEKPDGEEPYPLAELDLSEKTHWLDYSLAISITVLLAKEALVAHKSSFPEIEWETDDPDA